MEISLLNILFIHLFFFLTIVNFFILWQIFTYLLTNFHLRKFCEIDSFLKKQINKFLWKMESFFLQKFLPLKYCLAYIRRRYFSWQMLHLLYILTCLCKTAKAPFVTGLSKACPSW